MYCINCGSKVNVDDKFCSNCGNKVIYKNKFKNIKIMIDPTILPYLVRDSKIRRELNQNLVQVTSHGDSCIACKMWEGKILNDDVFTSIRPNYKYDLLSNAIKSGLFHDGCRHGLTTYYPELEDVSYDKEESFNSYSKNKSIPKELIIHIILFIFTAGIGNIIYLIFKTRKHK